MEDIVMVVPSCDKYNILWEPFFKLKDKYWKDCPFKPYLISENPYYPGVEGIKEENESWATNMKNALKKLDSPYIYIHLEDMILCEKVDTERVLKLFEIMKKEGVLRMGLTPFLREVNHPQFKEYKDLVLVGADPYRVSTQSGFWHRETFIEILKEGESIWETEIEGTYRTGRIDPITMMKDEWIIKVVNTIERGALTNQGKDFLTKEGFNFPKNTMFKIDFRY